MTIRGERAKKNLQNEIDELEHECKRIESEIEEKTTRLNRIKNKGAELESLKNNLRGLGKVKIWEPIKSMTRMELKGLFRAGLNDRIKAKDGKREKSYNFPAIFDYLSMFKREFTQK